MIFISRFVAESKCGNRRFRATLGSACLIAFSCWLLEYRGFGILRPYKELASLSVSGICHGVEVFKHRVIHQRTSWDHCDQNHRWKSPRAVLTTPQWIGEVDVNLAVFLTGSDVQFMDLMNPDFKNYMQIIGEKNWTFFMQEPQQLAHVQSSFIQFGVCVVNCQSDDWVLSHEFAEDGFHKLDALIRHIPDPRPIVNRFPCLDKNSSVSEVFISRLRSISRMENFVEADTSLLNFPDSSLAEMFPHATWTMNYPYPFVTGNHTIFEFASGPCDNMYCNWTGAECARKFDSRWFAMWQSMVDHALAKQGILVFCCHPASEFNVPASQVAKLVKHIHLETSSKVRFLTFKQALRRMEENMFFGQALRNADGLDNGVRILDLNLDGYMDVIVGNDEVQLCNIWDPKGRHWTSMKFPFQVVSEGRLRGLILGHTSKGVAVATLGRERAFLRMSDGLWTWKRVSLNCNL